MLIDTHAHLNFHAYKKDADEVVKRALEKEMLVVNVGSQYSTSVRAIEMAKKYPQLFAAVGLHPIHLKKRIVKHRDSEELDEIEIPANGEDFNYQKYLELVKEEKVVAVGEVGLDYHHLETGDNAEDLKRKQKEIFLEFIKLSNEVRKPIIIHCWDAYEELLEILKSSPVDKKGIIHSFIGNYKTARKFIDSGFKIGLNGIITYGISYDRLIKETELKDIVIETDCPYLTPGPHKGERNEPILVELVAQKIADIKGLTLAKVAEITTQNAKAVLGF
ncbi:MAG: TatD family hydrolase [Candidatus Moranbacteria bacterium]|nr:TatD family hydrolase [Candidatus Moranbacteria bacterium]